MTMTENIWAHSNYKADSITQSEIQLLLLLFLSRYCWTESYLCLAFLFIVFHICCGFDVDCPAQTPLGRTGIPTASQTSGKRGFEWFDTSGPRDRCCWWSIARHRRNVSWQFWDSSLFTFSLLNMILVVSNHLCLCSMSYSYHHSHLWWDRPCGCSTGRMWTKVP